MEIRDNVAIILNGTSSSGKTSIAKEIINAVETPIVHAQVDAFLAIFDFTKFRTEADAFEASRVGFSLFDSSINDMCQTEYPIVIDTVFERLEYFQNTMKAVEGRQIYLVGVYCPLAELCIREKNRGDRRVGLASEQFDDIHSGKQYALEVDTSKLSSLECADKIIELVNESGI